MLAACGPDCHKPADLGWSRAMAWPITGHAFGIHVWQALR
jgi:uncharacterized protein YfiM (DUF2279 family)